MTFAAGILFTVLLSVTGTVSALYGAILVPPGGYAWSAFTGSAEFSDFETVHTIAPGPLHGFSNILPDSAMQAVQLSAEWLRPDLATRFTDLLYLDVHSEMPAAPAFADVNGDGLEDLILESESGLRAFTAPNWLEFTEMTDLIELRKTCDINNDGSPDSSYFSDEGVLTLCSGDSILQITEGFDVADVTGTALGDMEGDGLADLVVGTGSGNTLVFRNRGTVEAPCFLPFSSESRMVFSMNAGAFSSPAIFALNDSVLVFAVGTQQEGLRFYTSDTGENLMSLEWITSSVPLNEQELLNISPVSVDIRGEITVICATRHGVLFEVGQDSDSLRMLDIPPVPGTYPNLTTAFMNGDDFPDLVAGTKEGGVYCLPGQENGFHSYWARIDGIPLIPSGAPAFWEDGLVFGSADGTLRYFSRSGGGDWVDCTEDSEFSSIDVGEYSTPVFFDMDSDGREELIAGNSSGSLVLFEKSFDGSRFLESFSWSFEPNNAVSDIESYYSRYFPPYSVFRSPSGSRIVNAFSREIINAEPRYRDEIAYCIAHTPADVLRAMYEKDDCDLFTVNASSLYEMAEKLDYVSLLDSTEGTICQLRTTEDGWVEISDESYYRFIVHPRILFEVPAWIDAEYWSTPRDTASTSFAEWLNYEPDSLYGRSPDHVFWREFIPSDSSGGRILEERIMDAETFDEAVVRLCNFQSHSQPEGLMTFGYLTNDLQPMVIYKKAYGSCGEQSILQTALCRTFFIPAYVVGCRGEDHQWSHYLDPASGRWNHWDINYGISGIGNLWVSGEGVNHDRKTISTISAFGPEGEVWSVTGSVLTPEGSGYMEGDSGYTATARVDILVADPDGIPAGGAMVMARSHWENANSVTVFDYTDESGICTFDLGWEPNGGYTIDVVSAFGSAGSSNIGFTEDRHYTVNYTVPRRIPQKQEVSLPASDSSPGIPVMEKLYPVPYFTGSLYSIGEEDNENLFRNPDWIARRETAVAGELMYMDGRNFSAYRNGLNCNAVRKPFIPEPGDTCFAVLDNRNSLFAWREYQLASREHSDPVEISNDVSAWLAEQPASREPAADPRLSGGSVESLDGNLNWITFYEDIELHQDDPEEPLSSEQIIGPFRIPSGERSLSIGTASNESDLDLDLFLFVDRNANRTVDGMSELVTKSTSPTANESIFLSEPDTSAVYWIYLHGWQVDEDGGMIDLGLSFKPEMLTVHSLMPAGHLRSVPQLFSLETSFESEDIYLRGGNSTIHPEKIDDRWFFEAPSDIAAFTDGSVQIFQDNGELIESIEWNIYPDSIPPELSILSAEVDSSTMKVLIEVECADALSGIEKIVLSVDTLESAELVLRGDSIWNKRIDVLPLSGETVLVEICAVDSAGNETKENFVIDIPLRPAVVFSSVYPSGSVYDHTPILQLFADFENPTPGWTAVGELSGNELAPFVVDGNIIQFSVNEFLQDGEYTAKVWIPGADGEIAGEYSWTFTVKTMTSTR